MDWLPASDVDLIGSATSIEGVITALTAHGCLNLTPLIDLGAFSEFPLGGGGYCDVYQGALRNGTRIALKSLRVCSRSEETIDVDKEKVLKRAAREMYCWSKLRHGNVLPLLGFTIFRGHLAMVSEWMYNGNLMAYRSRNPGMEWAKPVHGDLKAANVMISSDGVALISDFGNTQIKDLTLKFTSTTRNGISLRWAAPELLLSDTGPETSKEADVYAYGMTMLEIITGKVPYEGIADHRVLTLVAYEKQPPLRPDIEMHNELWAILMSCWNHDPADRPNISRVSDRLQALFRLSHVGNICEMDSKEVNDGEMRDRERSDEEMDELTSVNSFHEMNILASMAPPRPISIGDIYPRYTPFDAHSTSTDAESVYAMSISGTSLHSTRFSARSVLADVGSIYGMSISSLSLLSVPMSDAVPPRTSSQRHWMIADMNDEEFLRQLEARLIGVGGLLRQSRMLDDFAMGVNQSGAELEDYWESETDDSVAEREWIRVCRAMLCVREIVRTEKCYLGHLIAFRDSEASDAGSMSSILAEHLPRLIETSQKFYSLLEGDLSARGVSQAFLDAEEQLEATLVQWSSVTGKIIPSPYHRIGGQFTNGNGHTSSVRSSWIRRRSTDAGQADQTSFRSNLAMTPMNAADGGSKKPIRGIKCKKFTEQDIVVTPTSRTVRYTLLYQELLFHTSPTSAVREHVERALQAATRIARKCDEAQNHADHILSP